MAQMAAYVISWTSGTLGFRGLRRPQAPRRALGFRGLLEFQDLWESKDHQEKAKSDRMDNKDLQVLVDTQAFVAKQVPLGLWVLANSALQS